MYWWNLRAAKRDLSGEPFSSRQLLPYLVAVIALETAALEFSFLAPPADSIGPLQWLFGAVSVLLTAAGCIYVYRRNGGTRGERFLERFLVLGWIAGIRFAIVGLIGLILLVAFDVDKWIDGSAEVMGLFITAAYYLYLGRHVDALASPEQSS